MVVPRRAMALLVVTVLTMLIALGAYRYSFTMQAQYRVTRIHEEQVQARLAALSGLEVAAKVLEGSLAEREMIGGVGSNPAIFQHASIRSDARTVDSNSQSGFAGAHWHVSLISPVAMSDDQESIGGSSSPSFVTRTTNADNNRSGAQGLGRLVYGLENESAKLNVPTLLQWERQFPGHVRSALLRLPQAEARAVDDWLLGQGISSAGGVAGESRLIDRIQTSSSTRDRRSSREWFRWQWLGGDLNQNYQLDQLESALMESLHGDGLAGDNGSAQFSRASSTGDRVIGWQRYLTWHGGERNESPAGQPRVFLNDDNLLELHHRLSEIWPSHLADFVIAMRQYGPGEPAHASSSNVPSEVASPGWTPDFSMPATYQFRSVLDMVDMRVAVPVVIEQTPSSSLTGVNSVESSEGREGGNTTAKKRWLYSPFSSEMSAGVDYNERLLDETTVDTAMSRVGRVDIRHAPLEVLAGVPGVDQQLAEQIVQRRSAAITAVSSSNTSLSPSSERGSLFWLLTEGLVDLSRLKQLEPYLTNRSDVYRVQAVGYRDALSPVHRCTAVIDALQGSARIIEHQVWHAWDRGFPVDRFAPRSQ